MQLVIIFFLNAGVDGSDGIQGPQGRGLRGDPGQKGEKGEKGLQGVPGWNGTRGLKGFAGIKGQKGERGVNGLKGSPGPTTGGVVYTRWGRTTCPSTSGTQTLYAGRVAGSFYHQTGGGANYLCLPEQPQYFTTYSKGEYDWRALLYGAEYEAGSGPNANHNVPCAVCYTSTWQTVVMIPAQYTCPSSWTREYYGYLTANYHGYQRTMYECMDRFPQSVPGSSSNINGALFYGVEIRCNYGIPCPPYDSQKEVTCVVCTK